MRLVIFKSMVRKSIDNGKLDFYKNKLLAILDKKEKEENKDINKSLEFIEKGNGLPPGTKKEWPAGSGRWYVKTGQGKWIRTYNNSGSRGAKQSIAYMRKKIQSAESLEELLNIVQENKDKFTDDQGKPIDIVKDLMREVHTKHQDFKGAADGAKETADKVLNDKKATKSKEDPKTWHDHLDTFKEQAKTYKMNIVKFAENKLFDAEKYDYSPAETEALNKILESYNKQFDEYYEETLGDNKTYGFENNIRRTGKDRNEVELKKDIERMERVLKQDNEDLKNRLYNPGNVAMLEADKAVLKELKARLESFNQKETKTIDDIKNKYQNSKSVQGNSKTIHIGDEKIKCHYKLVEADTPTASHDEQNFQKTPGFPTNNGGTINDRDYENDASAKEGVMRIAGNYDGRALENPPIVTKDGIVISGNNRTMSSKLAAKNGTDKEYINELKDVIEDYGIDEEELSNFKNPRIILEIDKEHEGEYTTDEFAKFNKTDQKSKSTVEKAVEVSKTIKPDTIQNLAEHISEFDTLGDLYNNKKAAREFVDSLVINGVINKNEIAQYYTEQAGLSENGKEFIETTLVGGIMNENNIRSLSGAGGKSLRQKLVRAIVPLIDNKGIGKEYTFNDELNKAVNIVLEIQQGGKFTTVQEYMDQGNLFGDTVDPLTGRLAQLLHENTQKEFAEKMREVEGGLRPSANGEFDIFLGECETRDSILDRILDIKTKVSKALHYVFDLLD